MQSFAEVFRNYVANSRNVYYEEAPRLLKNNFPLGRRACNILRLGGSITSNVGINIKLHLVDICKYMLIITKGNSWHISYEVSVSGTTKNKGILSETISR